MKIAFFVHGYLPWDRYGVPRYVERLSNYLANKGHKVVIFCMGRQGLPKTEEASQNLKIYRSWYFNPPRFLARAKDLWSLTLYSLWCLVAVPKIVCKEEIDVLHGHTFRYGGIQCLIVSAITRKPRTITIHGVGLAQNKVDEIIQRLLMPCFNLVICEKSSVLEKLISWGLKGKALKMSTGGIDTEKFKPSGNKDPAGKLTVTFVGRLIAFKGPQLLLDSIPYVLSLCKRVCFLFVGDGPLMEYLVRKSRLMGLEDDIRFLGEREDIDEILKASDIFVAVSPYENFTSTSLFEAMSCGLAIVATDVGETRTLTQNKETLLLAKPDPYDISEKILKLLYDRSLRERLGKNARELIVEKHSLEVLGRNHEKIYVNISQKVR